MKAIPNITYHSGNVSSDDRERIVGQRGCVVWLTGLSGSGKSTIAHALERKLVDHGHLAYVLDGDNLRHGLNGDLGFSETDREENVRRVAEVAALLAKTGTIVITSLISPYRVHRDRARSLVPADRFLEIFIDVPLEECEARDPKGLYQRARRGEIADFTGISAPYEEPASPELRVRSSEKTVEQSVDEIYGLLEKRALLTLSSVEVPAP